MGGRSSSYNNGRNNVKAATVTPTDDPNNVYSDTECHFETASVGITHRWNFGDEKIVLKRTMQRLG